ncbi:MAG TPA: GNAT family N-acetyltransferase [Vicinamibacterales bacterium]
MPVDVRAYRDSDETAILDLFARAFGTPRTREHFDWKYRRNPFGNGHISVAADDGHRVMAHYAGVPLPFVDDGKNMVAHHIGDIMSDPSVRHAGRGASSVFGRTALHFHRHFCEGRVAFNYGFHTAASRGMSIRFLGAQYVEPVPLRVLDLARDPLAPMSRLQRSLRGYRVEPMREASSDLDRFFVRVAPDYRFLLRRDATYVRWRHLDCPDPGAFVVAIRKFGRLAGWSVFRVRGEQLIWGDALFDPHHPDAAGVLLRSVVTKQRVTSIAAWFPPRPAWFDVILRDLHFEPATDPNDLSLSCNPFLCSDATRRMREALYYTMADSDLF